MNWYKKAQESEIEVYHGTNNVFSGFDSNKQQSGYYTGFYVTSSKNHALTFGNNIYTFALDPSKYYEINNDKAASELKNKAQNNGFNANIGSGSGEVNYLKNLGYHGIKRGIEYIVFDPNKNLRIK